MSENHPTSHSGSHLAGPVAPTTRSAWGRLWRAGRPRATRAQALAAVLTLLLGFAVVTQVRQTQQTGLSALRQDDLVNVLDDVNQRETRLEDEARQLAGHAAEAAVGLEQLSGRAAGRPVPAGHPRHPDRDQAGQRSGHPADHHRPGGKVSAATVLDTVEELRDAGAEAIQIGTVRVVASTSFVDGTGSSPAGIAVDGTLLARAVRRPGHR